MLIDITPPGSKQEKITEIYCVIEYSDKGEGIVAKLIDKTLFPLIFSDEKVKDAVCIMARELQKESGKKLKLLKFTHREELEL